MGLLQHLLFHGLFAVPLAASTMEGLRASPLEAHAAPLEPHGAAAAVAHQPRPAALRQSVAERAKDVAQKLVGNPDAKTTGLRTAQKQALQAAPGALATTGQKKSLSALANATASSGHPTAAKRVEVSAKKAAPLSSPAHSALAASAAKDIVAAVHVAKSNASTAVREGGASHGEFTLMKAADLCSCKFEDTCACDKLIGFMDCVVNACSSGQCDCHGLVFRDACAALGESCEGVHVQCSKKKAVCTHEDEGKSHAINVTAATSVEDIYSELKLLKQERCRFTAAESEGWLNADNQLKGVLSKIKKHMRELVARGARLPEMHCQKHFEEWHDPPTLAPQKGSAIRRLAAPALLVLAVASSL